MIDPDEFIIHNSQNTNFQWGPNKQFEGQTMNEARLQFNHAMAENFNFPPCEVDDTLTIPADYNFREDEERKTCVQPVRQNGNCTASHVNAVLSAFEDRMCVKKEGTETFRFSARDVIACDDSNFKCTGGYVTNVFKYGAEMGFIAEEAEPWSDDWEENQVCKGVDHPARKN